MRTILVSLACAASAFAADTVDLAVVNRIKAEAFQNSKVMEHLEFLTDRYGPRLTGSPEFKEAADWALQRLGEYGLVKGHLEKWGPFGRSWSLQKFSLEMTEPRYSLLAAWPPFAFQAVQPMSDTVATFWALGTILCALRSRRDAASIPEDVREHAHWRSSLTVAGSNRA